MFLSLLCNLRQVVKAGLEQLMSSLCLSSAGIRGLHCHTQFSLHPLLNERVQYQHEGQEGRYSSTFFMDALGQMDCSLQHLSFCLFCLHTYAQGFPYQPVITLCLM